MKRTRPPWLPILFFQTCCPATWCWRLLTQCKGSKVELEPGKVWGRNVVENSIAWYCMHVLSFFCCQGFILECWWTHLLIPIFYTLIPPSSTFFKRLLQANDSHAAGLDQATHVNPACLQTWAGGWLDWAQRYPMHTILWLATFKTGGKWWQIVAKHRQRLVMLACVRVMRILWRFASRFSSFSEAKVFWP